jgi:hypothetical protein
MYFIKREAKYNTSAAKEELSRANHTTKAEKEKRRKPIETDPDEPTKPVKRQPDTTKGKTNQAKHDYLHPEP